MKARLTTKSVEHRARCKHCGTKPLYYTNVFGQVYHLPNEAKGTVGRTNKAYSDYRDRPWQSNRSYFHENYLRSNGIRGTAVTSSWYFKKTKSHWGGYRIMLSCKCGYSTWMFQITGDAETWLRLPGLDLKKYKYRTRLEDPNIGKY